MKYKNSIILPMLFIAGTLSGQSTCDKVTSSSEDPGPAQYTGQNLPDYINDLDWVTPSLSTRTVDFSGVPGTKASHEGMDYVHDNINVPHVYVIAASEGTVAYVRDGCPESATFSRNISNRECGAGWGNHIVLKHGANAFTRYAHLQGNSSLVKVGDTVEGGQVIAKMGNSGRSEVRHLHFELGTKAGDFDACAMSQNFDYVFNPDQLQQETETAIGEKIEKESLIVYRPCGSTNFIIKIPSDISGDVRLYIYDIYGCKLYEENLINRNNEIMVKSALKGNFLIYKIQTAKSVLFHKLLN